MLKYQVPQQDMEFLLFDLFQVNREWTATPAFADLDADLVRAVLGEAGKSAGTVMAIATGTTKVSTARSQPG